MAETIESFVAKLQAEGVQAGRQEADKIRSEAQRQAGETLRQAKAQADKIVAEAQASAQSLLTRAKTELELAARDALFRLRESISQAIQAILAERARRQLADANFLSQVMRELVLLYGQADAERKTNIRFNVPPDIQEKLAGWVMGELHKAAQAANASVDLHGTLSSAGFEYRANGATVEVTVESVVQTLKDLVGPELKNVLDRAVASK